MTKENKLKQLLFPHENARSIQEDMIKEVDHCISLNKNLIVHAPTGLGKTAATLPIALSHAIKKNKTVFFLTSRHTQHKIAIDTLKQIKKKYEIDVLSVDIIGKQWMCPIPGITTLYSSEFNEYCKSQREENKCEFYANTRSKSTKPTVKAQKVMEELKKNSPYHCEDNIKACVDEKLCPYEIAMMLAREAKVVIGDYYYMFHPGIRDTFLKKSEKELQDCIIIIDEAHNLPRRCAELLTQKTSTFLLQSALKEANKFGEEKSIEYLTAIRDILENLGKNIPDREDEILIKKEEFTDEIKLIDEYDAIITELTFAGDRAREKQKRSFIGSVAHFLESWLGPDESFARIISKKETKGKPTIVLSYRCLDPSLLTKDIVNNAYSTIIMSGTLSPTSMYAEILGFDKTITVEKEFSSPFPAENRLSIIIPETTTKFTQRNPEQYKNIAKYAADIVNSIPGNSAVFFPSYQLRDDINRYFEPVCTKTIFYEAPMLSKTEKDDLLERFKTYKDNGAVLLGIAAGSFSQGIDLPGNLLKAVVVVGLPLQKPDLETKELIDYYEKKFKKGWDYGYVFPAITKCLQSAGRCIRSEKDRGVIIFLDERFAWPMYKKYFPPDWKITITKDYSGKIKEFFSQ